MATRVICDHCGNTISDKNPKRYHVLRPPYTCFVPVQGANLGGIYGAATAVASTVDKPVYEVELCQRCDEIWLNRVKNLTIQTEEASK